MIVDTSYYKDVYKGIETNNFDKLNLLAQSIIETLTEREEKILLSSPFVDNVKKSICSQIEYFSINGEEKAINAQETGQMKSENIGSYSYTRANVKSSETVKYLNGVPIAPMVWIFLSKTDLLYKGVEKYV